VRGRHRWPRRSAARGAVAPSTRPKGTRPCRRKIEMTSCAQSRDDTAVGGGHDEIGRWCWTINSLVRLKGLFLGADLHSGLLGAQGGSKARSGTGATRSEASMARTHPLARLSTRLIIASGGPKLMRSCFGFCRPWRSAGHPGSLPQTEAAAVPRRGGRPFDGRPAASILFGGRCRATCPRCCRGG
jgi:hypothetical protein